MKKTQFISNFFWDLFCTLSIVGIWPRFIEPKLICTTLLTLPIPELPPSLHGFKILQFSDLHFHAGMSHHFLKKLQNKINNLHPDLIVFSGDFLCYSQLPNSNSLISFLNSLHAPYGCYAILGNHDYAQYISINKNGEYDLIPNNTSSSLSKAFKRLFETIQLKKITTEKAKVPPLHTHLTQLLANTPFKLLHNKTEILSIRNAKLNISGLGEYMAGHCQPSETFKNYDLTWPGLILLHNPDGIHTLKNAPGQIVLSGHTHGGQVNLPWMWKKLTLLENMQFKKGLFQMYNKWLYVNRGISSILPFRWFAPPELLLLTLQ